MQKLARFDAQRQTIIEPGNGTHINPTAERILTWPSQESSPTQKLFPHTPESSPSPHPANNQKTAIIQSSHDLRSRQSDLLNIFPHHHQTPAQESSYGTKSHKLIPKSKENGTPGDGNGCHHKTAPPPPHHQTCLTGVIQSPQHRVPTHVEHQDPVWNQRAERPVPARTAERELNRPFSSRLSAPPLYRGAPPYTESSRNRSTSAHRPSSREAQSPACGHC